MWTLLLNKYVVGGIAVVLLLISLGTGLMVWKHSIQNQALLEFNNKQLEQVVADQKKFNDLMTSLNAVQKKISDDLASKNQALDEKLNGIEGYLTSAEAKKSDRDASEVLKKTIEELRK